MTTLQHADGPFGQALDAYLDAGWQCVLPLPCRAKEPPPVGYTGHGGAVPDEETYAGWRRSHRDGNIGLRLPSDVVGIDVDQYGKKTGAEQLRALETAWGELPATWISSSRPAPSGIRFYRLPSPVALHDKPGDSIEILQHHHRYATVRPSVHPSGAAYGWVTPDGEIADRPPRPDELPMLPERWLEGLRADRPRQVGPRSVNGTHVEPTRSVREALYDAVLGLGGGRHDAALVGVMALARFDDLGHPGAGGAIDALRVTFVSQVTSGDGARSQREAEDEWDRMLAGARAKVAATPATAPRWEPPEKRSANGNGHHDDGDPGPTPPGDLDDGAEARAPGCTIRSGWAERDRAHAAADTEADEARRASLFTVWNVGDLLAADRTFRWAIRGLAVDPTFGMLGGGRKTLKTYVDMVMNLALASGRPAFGRFHVDAPRPVVVYIGEGGRIPWTRRLERVAAAMNLTPADLRDLPLYSSFDVAPLNSERFTESLGRDLDRYRPGMVTIDPLYAYHGAQSDGSSLFQEGALLTAVSRRCEDAGSGLKIVHHFNKTGSGAGLDRLTMVGGQEWSDSWWLLSHRENPDVARGSFRLLLEVGSRQWGGAEWDLDIELGVFDEDLGEYIGAIEWDIRRHVDRGEDDRLDALQAAVLEVVADQPWQRTKTEIVALVGGHQQSTRHAIDTLIGVGNLVCEPRPRAEGTRTVTRQVYGPPVNPDQATDEVGPGWPESA